MRKDRSDLTAPWPGERDSEPCASDRGPAINDDRLALLESMFRQQPDQLLEFIGRAMEMSRARGATLTTELLRMAALNELFPKRGRFGDGTDA
jgi:hypothetical protein